MLDIEMASVTHELCLVCEHINNSSSIPISGLAEMPKLWMHFSITVVDPYQLTLQAYRLPNPELQSFITSISAQSSYPMTSSLILLLLLARKTNVLLSSMTSPDL